MYIHAHIKVCLFCMSLPGIGHSCIGHFWFKYWTSLRPTWIRFIHVHCRGDNVNKQFTLTVKYANKRGLQKEKTPIVQQSRTF